MRLTQSQAIAPFIEALQRISEKKSEVFIALSGGGTFDDFHPSLIQAIESLPTATVKKIRWCFVDERVVPLVHPDSNYWGVNTKFFTPLKEKNLLLDNHILAIDPDHPTPARHYTKLVPRIDIGFFGVGPDGHTASLFPGHELLDVHKDAFLEITDSPKPPPHRITVSPKMIRNIDTSFLFIIGEAKQQAFDNFMDEDLDVEDCPCKLVMESKNWFVVRD